MSRETAPMVSNHAEIRTSRLRLRTLKVADAELILQITSIPEVMKWTSQLPHTRLDQVERWLDVRTTGPTVFNFAIELLNPSPGSLEIIGVLGSYHWPEVGYLVHPDHAGKGYATEALNAWIPAFFERMHPASVSNDAGFDYVQAGTDMENYGSRRVLEKAGFTHCETRFQDYENPAQGIRDSVYFRIARPGTTLQQLVLGPTPATEHEDEPPVPPIR